MELTDVAALSRSGAQPVLLPGQNVSIIAVWPAADFSRRSRVSRVAASASERLM